jgi:hypothetical protein
VATAFGPSRADSASNNAILFRAVFIFAPLLGSHLMPQLGISNPGAQYSCAVEAAHRGGKTVGSSAFLG